MKLTELFTNCVNAVRVYSMNEPYESKVMMIGLSCIIGKNEGEAL